MNEEEKRLKQRERSRRYRLLHAEHVKESKRKYRAANRDKEREASKVYYRSHPDKIREIQARKKSKACPDCGKRIWNASSTCTKCYGVRKQVSGIGEANPHWKGGIRLTGGYVQRLAHGHPAANKEGYIPEHRLVMEKMIGRHLRKNELVHHLNQVRTDNRPDNLLLCSMSEHKKIHYALEREP